MDWSENMNEAVGRVRSTLDETILEVEERLQQMHERYFGLERDDDLQAHLKALFGSIAAQRQGNLNIPGKRRILTIVGETNSGKSRALIEHVVKAKELQSYESTDGQTYDPLLIFDAPSPCIPRMLALEGLHKLNYPVRKSMYEAEAWDTFRIALKANKIMVVCLDEAQHTVDTASKPEKQKIANSLKNLVQMPDWPIRLILAGVPPLDDFVKTYKQIASRNYRVSFAPMADTDGRAVIETRMDRVIKEHAGLAFSDELSTGGRKGLISRLLVAADGEFGEAMRVTRETAEMVIRGGRQTVSLSDFAEAYRWSKGCPPEENPFTEKGWLTSSTATDDVDVEALPEIPAKTKEPRFGGRL